VLVGELLQHIAGHLVQDAEYAGLADHFLVPVRGDDQDGLPIVRRKVEQVGGEVGRGPLAFRNAVVSRLPTGRLCFRSGTGLK
jgi:hypothetical protein